MILPVPVIQDADVLIIGAALTGCETALRLRKAGRRVLLASEDCALGTDVLGRLDREAALSSALLKDYPDPETGCAGLARTLLEAGVEFLYEAIPVRPLFSALPKRLSGWIFFGGNRYFAIASKAVVDATCDGLLPYSLRLARRSSALCDCLLEWNVLTSSPEAASSAEREILLPPVETPDGVLALCRYRKRCRLRECDLIGRLQEEDALWKELSCDRSAIPARWPAFHFASFTEELFPSSPEMPFFQAPHADMPALLQCSRPGIPLADSFQAIDGRSPLAPEERLVWENLPSSLGDTGKIQFSLEALASSAPVFETDVLVVGAGAAGCAAARAIVRQGLRCLLLESTDRISGEALPAGIACWRHCRVCGAVLDQKRLKGCLVLTSSGECCLVRAGRFVDATGQGLFAAGCGAPMHFFSHSEAITHDSVVAPRLTPRFPEGMPLQAAMGSDSLETTWSRVFFQLTAPGTATRCENAGISPSMRIQAKFTLLPHDLVLNRHFPDTIAMAEGRFPERQSCNHPLLWLTDLPGTRFRARIPYCVLLPPRPEGMLVLGEAISAHQDVLRCCSGPEFLCQEGTAAGLAAVLSLRQGVLLSQISLPELQQQMIAEGALPADFLQGDAKISAGDFPMALAQIFYRPDQARRCLQAQFDAQPELRTALALAFLGDSSGRDFLTAEFRKCAPGSDSERMVLLLDALAVIGTAPRHILEAFLQVDETAPLPLMHSFSEFFRRWPARDAARHLRLLLEASVPGEFPRGLSSVLHAGDSAFLASLSKAIVLASALHACAPGDENALNCIQRCRKSWCPSLSLLAQRALTQQP